MNSKLLPLSSSALRRELSARNLQRAASFVHEASFGRVASVVYGEAEDGTHGNFLPAVYRRIVARPEWRKRLSKVYTGSAWIARAQDRERRELECCTSSDALLMNVFCYPGVLRRAGFRALLGVERNVEVEFGVRADLPMRGGEKDRTEIDLRLASLIVESKLSETGFGTASRDRLMRYSEIETVFDVDALPWGARTVAGYQLVRGALAAFHGGGRYLLLCDGRRMDLQEQWLRVIRAIHTSELRSRMVLLSWQELAATLPATLRAFLEGKYGIVAG